MRLRSISRRRKGWENKRKPVNYQGLGQTRANSKILGLPPRKTRLHSARYQIFPVRIDIPEKKFEFESAGTSTVAASDPRGGKKVDEERRTFSKRGFSGGQGGLQITSWRNINKKCQAARRGIKISWRGKVFGGTHGDEKLHLRRTVDGFY